MFLFLLLNADCSGRSLATLLVAWVATAMVASVLLRWEYMWIVLTVLTLLFLLVCGYTAYNARKTHERSLINEQTRATNAVRERRERDIRTVSGMTGDHGEVESSIYAAHSMMDLPDLPPSYASVVSTPASSRQAGSLPIDRSHDIKFEEPPSYSIVIAALDAAHDRIAESPNEPRAMPYTAKSNSASVISI